MVDFLVGIAVAAGLFAVAWWDFTHEHWALQAPRARFEERPYGFHRWSYLAQWLLFARVVPTLLVVGGVAALVFAVRGLG